MSGEKLIGVVGGMGPYAGLDLVEKVFDETVAGKDQEHVPLALLSIPERIVDRTEYIVGEVDENPGYAIAELALRLEQMGAVVAGMPCNSAHNPPIFDVIQAELSKAGSRLRILHLIHETAQFIRQQFPNIRCVGVLSTTSIYRLRVYHNALADVDIEVVLHSPEIQEEVVHPSIYHPTYGIKAQSQPVSRRARQDLEEVIAMLKNEGAEAIVLGCTELPLAIPEPSLMGLPMIDPTRALARALIQATYPEKLAPVTSV